MQGPENGTMLLGRVLLSLLRDHRRGENHQVPSWFFAANSLRLSTAGVVAARASRSKLAASSKTAFLAPGSVNCPATSRACSARSSHSNASFDIDGILVLPP